MPLPANTEELRSRLINLIGDRDIRLGQVLVDNQTALEAVDEVVDVIHRAAQGDLEVTASQRIVGSLLCAAVAVDCP